MQTPETLRPARSDRMEQKPQASFQNIVDFLKEQVYPIGLKTQIPSRHPNQSEAQQQRNLQIAGLYIGTEKALEEIGGNNLSRERIRQIVKKAVSNLHRIQTPEVREAFPWESFDFDKSHTLEGRQRKSQQRGSKNFKIAEMMSQGISPPEIKETLGLSTVSLCKARRILKNWGINIPTEKELYQEKVEKLRDPYLPDAEAQKILNATTKSDYGRLSIEEKPVLIPVSRVARGADLLFTSRDIKFFYSILRKSGIPARSVPRQKPNNNPRTRAIPSYYFIRSLDTNRAIATLKKS